MDKEIKTPEVNIKLSGIFPDALAIKINKDGTPKHPLYTNLKTLWPVKFN